MRFQALPRSTEKLDWYRFDTSIPTGLSKEYRVFLAVEGDRSAIEALRIEAYKQSDDFQLLDLTPVLWNGADSAALVLVVEREGEVIATMRATLVADPLTIVQHLGAAWPSAAPFKGPVMVLERAATKPEFRRLGLNSMLRLCFFRMAMTMGVKQIAGSVYQGTARIALMETLGYAFHPIEEDHDDWVVKADAPRLTAILDLERDGQRACDVLASRH